jgi:hypothetical protein
LVGEVLGHLVVGGKSISGLGALLGLKVLDGSVYRKVEEAMVIF